MDMLKEEVGLNIKRSSAYDLARDVHGLKTLFVNVYFIGIAGEGNKWVLVDAGLRGSSGKIIKEAEKLFGENNPPEFILLTHGHFDHIGALPELLKYWPETKVFAHPLEIPYLTGKSSYPPPDPSVGKGGMALMSWTYPISPINLGERVRALPATGGILDLPDWKWYHTPGHSPGHVSFFRATDRLLIAGDAFVSTDQNSLSAVINQKKEIHGPPAYFTIDWPESLKSIQILAGLDAEIAGTGHGKPLFHGEVKRGLYDLINNFEKSEIPKTGRYVTTPPRTSENGVEEMPPAFSYYIPRYFLLAAGLAGLSALGYNLFNMYKDQVRRLKPEEIA